MSKQLDTSGLSEMTGISESRLGEILNLNELRDIEISNFNDVIAQYSRYEAKNSKLNIYG